MRRSRKNDSIRMIVFKTQKVALYYAEAGTYLRDNLCYCGTQNESHDLFKSASPLIQ